MTCRLPVPGRFPPLFLKAYEMLWFPVIAGWLVGDGRGRRRINGRLALNLPPRRPAAGAIWIHALSVGEVLSALPLVEALRRARPETPMVFSAATEQGFGIAERMLADAVDRLLPLPLDFPWSLRRVFNHVRPSLFVLVETDIWPGLIGGLAQRRVPCLLVNGRVSPRTYRTYRRFAPLVRTLFSGFTLCLMQTELDRRRLLSIGVSPQQVETVGNIKFDRPMAPMGEPERSAWFETLGLTAADRLWVAGSTHPGEEGAVLTAQQRLQPEIAGLRLIIAPRRIEDAAGIVAQAGRMGLAARLRSAPGGQPADWKVLVVDTLGELGRIYGLAQANFVGGSLVPTGGHNLLEPAGFGRPVLFGPHTFNFDDMATRLEAEGGGIRVSDGAALGATLRSLFDDDRRRASCGLAALEFVHRNQGAVRRVLDCIDRIGAEFPAPTAAN